MSTRNVPRKWPSVVTLLALLAGSLLGMFTGTPAAQAATSADPSEEIVYIDRSGVIRVLDTQGEAPRVEWYSPTGDWKDADLGDVNDDGDLEIIAIGETAAGDVKIAVFDPVIASGIADPNKTIPPPPADGIPWDTLWETEIAGTPHVIQAGNFDNAIPGDELLYAYEDPASVARVVVMNASSLDPSTGKPTGRDWKVHVEFEDGDINRTWRFARSGDVNNRGSAEAVLVDSKEDDGSPETRFDVFDVDQGFLRIDGKNSDNDTIRKVAIGQIIEGNGEEIAEIRTTRPGSDSLIVYKWDAEDADLNTDESWAFSPQPEYVFLADLDGNGDKEVVFLRNNPDDDGSRLIMRDDWGDDQDRQLDIEESLEDLEGGVDNEFKIGAGGDVDGDGRDEIIIASSTRIVIFRDPHPGGSIAPGSRTEILRDTNNDTLLVGDLDSEGFILGPIFGVDKNLVEASLPTGTVRSAGSVTISNLGSGNNVDFQVVTPLPSWVQVDPLTGVTPRTINITFDATNEPVGTKSFTMQITSNSDVVNKPFPIQLVMTVEPAALSLNPPVANFIYFPCTPPIDETMEMVVDVGGTAGLNYEAIVLGIPEASAAAGSPLAGTITGGMVDESGTVVLYDDAGGVATFARPSAQNFVAASNGITWTNNVDWITQATSVTNTVPSSVTLAVNPQTLGADFTTEQAVMVFVADTRAGSPPENVEILPIMMMCAEDRVLAPTLFR